MSLLIFGPLPPIRGGVAKHNQELVLAVGEHADVRAISPVKLYPDFLFPGAKQLDNSLLCVSTPKVARKSWLKVIWTLVVSKPKVFMFVWWTHYFAPIAVFASFVMRLKGAKCSVFCHNVLPHDSGRLATIFTRLSLSRFAHHTVQSEAESERLNELIGKRADLVLPHPQMPVGTSLEPQLKSDPRSNSDTKRTFLFIGLIRQYKGAPLAAEAFREVEGEDLRLRVIGECWDDELRNQITESAANDPRITFVDDYVSEEQFLSEISAADFILLPYTKVTGSQILATAAGFGTPVIASDIPGFKEKVRHGETGLLFSPESLNSLSSAMRQALSTNFSDSSNSEFTDWKSAGLVLAESLGLK